MFDFEICTFSFFFVGENMDIAAEQHVAIKYSVYCGKTRIKTLSELKEAYEDECLAKLTVLKWHAIFVKNLSAVPVHAKSTGWHRSQITEVNINTVWAVIDEHWHVLVRHLRIRSIFHDWPFIDFYVRSQDAAVARGTGNCFYINSQCCQMCGFVRKFVQILIFARNCADF